MSGDGNVLARLCGVRKSYGGIAALEGVDLSLRGGELLALLGPNGAGKSTAIGLLLGLIRADAGTVELLGEAPWRLSARRGIGVMLQSATLPPMLRVGELIRLAASYYPAPRTLQESAELAGVIDLLRRPYGRLSGGQQRSVQFALALCGRPRLLFLDEPTTGLDIQARHGLWSAIRQLLSEGCAVLLTTHYLEEAEALADRVCVMMRGRVISEGSVDALRARVALKRVRCRSEVDPATARTWPEVTEARMDGERLWLSSERVEDLLRRLLAADSTLTHLEVRAAGLGEAFTELTRDAEATASTHSEAA